MSDGQQQAASSSGSRELEMRKTQILGGGWKTNRWQAERRPDNLFQGYNINPRHRTTKNLFQATSSKGSGLILGASLLPNTAAMDVRFWMKSDCFVKLFFGSVDNLFCQVLSRRVVFLWPLTDGKRCPSLMAFPHLQVLKCPMTSLQGNLKWLLCS